MASIARQPRTARNTIAIKILEGLSVRCPPRLLLILYKVQIGQFFHCKTVPVADTEFPVACAHTIGMPV